jgi:hypothetical protein
LKNFFLSVKIKKEGEGMEENKIIDTTKINDFVQEINSKLEKFKKDISITLIICVAVSILSFGILLLPSITIYIIIVIIKYSKLNNNKMESEFIDDVVKEISQDLSFSSSSYVSQENFLNSNFGQKGFSRYTGSNLISGIVNNAKIELCNLLVCEENRIYNVQQDRHDNIDTATHIIRVMLISFLNFSNFEFISCTKSFILVVSIILFSSIPSPSFFILTLRKKFFNDCLSPRYSKIIYCTIF